MTQNYLQQSDFIALKAYKTKNCSDCLSSDIIPCANRKYNLGSAQYAFNEIHAKKIFVDANTLVIGSGVTLSANGTKLLVNGKEITSVFETLLTLLSTGQANQVLSSDGAGGLFWQTGGGGSAGDLQSVCDNGRVYQRSDPTSLGNKVQTTIITPSISTINKKNATLTTSGTTYSHTIDTSCLYISDDGATLTSETGLFFNLVASGPPLSSYNIFSKMIVDPNSRNIIMGGTNNGGTNGTGLNLLIANDKNLSINSDAGLTGYVLTSQGGAAPPVWAPGSFLGATGTCPQNSWVSVNSANNALPSVNTQIGYTYASGVTPYGSSAMSGTATLFSQTVPAGIWIIHCKVTIGNPSTTTILTVTAYSLEISTAGGTLTKNAPYTAVGSLFTLNTYPGGGNYVVPISYVATFTTSETVSFKVGYTKSTADAIQLGNYTNDFVRITRIA